MNDTTPADAQPAEVAAFLAACPIIGPGPQVNPLPSGGYAVTVTGEDADPVVAILQRVAVSVRHPDGWMGTPGRWYARSLREGNRAGLAIDFGADWTLPDADAASVFALADRLAPPAATDVVVYGPNIRFDDGADFHVHRVGCAHLTQRPYSRVERGSDQGNWTMQARTAAGVLDAIYGDFDEPQAYAETVHVFPCAGLA